jgi:hypothetical protein
VQAKKAAKPAATRTSTPEEGPMAPAGSDDRHGPTALQPAGAQRGFCLHLLAVAQLGFCLQGAIDLIDPRQTLLDRRQYLFLQA